MNIGNLMGVALVAGTAAALFMIASCFAPPPPIPKLSPILINHNSALDEIAELKATSPDVFRTINYQTWEAIVRVEIPNCVSQNGRSSSLAIYSNLIQKSQKTLQYFPTPAVGSFISQDEIKFTPEFIDAVKKVETKLSGNLTMACTAEFNANFEY